MNTIQQQFHDAMLDVYEKVGRSTGYWAYRYLAKVRRSGGVDAAKYWLAKKDVSAGFERLKKEGRLEYAMENLVLRPDFQGLFSEEEVGVARQRLKDYGVIKEK